MCNAIRDIQLCNSSFATDNNRRIPLHLHPPTPIHLDATLALPLQSACRGSRGLCNTPIIRVVGPLQCHSAIGLEGTCQGQMGAHEGVPDACLSRGHQRGGGEEIDAARDLPFRNFGICPGGYFCVRCIRVADYQWLISSSTYLFYSCFYACIP